MAKRDLTGSVFTRLTVLGPTADRQPGNREIIWACRCDCGREIGVSTGSLNRDQIRSCGCLQIERRYDQERFNIAGTRSGKLVAVVPTGLLDRAGSRLWECRCDCGRTKNVAAYNVKKGFVISCGCARKSRVGVRAPEIRSRRLEHQNVRRARQLGALGIFTEAEVSALRGRQKHKCAICFKRLMGANFHRDHITPLTKGGSNYISNIQLLCPGCNLRKTDKDPFAHALERGLLV